MNTRFPPGLTLRPLETADHLPVLDAVTRWWSTPNASELGLLLPRLFFQHFTTTSWVLERPTGEIAAFLVGFRSQADPAVAYIHFVGVDPALRRTGTATALYEHFFERMRASGCSRVHCITSPANETSQAFHLALGFASSGPVADYDGPGHDRVAFTRAL